MTRMRTVRTLRKAKPAPRRLSRGDFDLTDATMEADPGPPPEAVFDRMTGPFDHRRHAFASPGSADEET
jgi:hypothetical protein